MNDSNAAEHSGSTAVIEAVADKMGTVPRELPQQLYEVIDPDALDALSNTQKTTKSEIRFSYCGYDVTLREDGTVTVDE
ncbi:HalOD1 output domain-containing protein [Halobellus rufus]|uniref:HalOD1 output domain-containing protein n=1 Tax=Halobellus rufus TaxID=1448860 RepID=UPI0006792D88|nr:HalOD1 output domain-containing protein [Halobellus rufus]